MSSGIVKYEPLCEITTYIKKKYYIKAKNRQALEEMMETKKFVKFGTSTVNVVLSVLRAKFCIRDFMRTK